nr:immunoglobulin light chain junction region [Macaca mulatta]
CMQGIQFPITF